MNLRSRLVTYQKGLLTSEKPRRELRIFCEYCDVVLVSEDNTDRSTESMKALVDNKRTVIRCDAS